jgi:hypothetical protein
MDADANILLTIDGEPKLTIDDMAMPADAGGDARGEHNPAPVQRVGPVLTTSSSSSSHLHDRCAFVIVAADPLVTVSAVRAYG